MTFEGEYQWMKRLAREHPVFRDLPQEVQDSLAVPPGEWRDLPFNKRRRKRMKRDGVVAHVYAGPSEGHTLASALQLCGGEPTSIIEIDILRSQEHDMLLNQGPYAGLLRCALEGKLKALLGGPNCRTRSLLRHIPIENNPMAPRPIPKLLIRPKTKLPVQKLNSHPWSRPFWQFNFKAASSDSGLAALFSIFLKQSGRSSFELAAKIQSSRFFDQNFQNWSSQMVF